MLKVVRFICPDCERHDSNRYDFGYYKPCIGLCGHTVCLACIKGWRKHCEGDMPCPICKDKKAFKKTKLDLETIELMKYYHENYWEAFKKFWKFEGPFRGECSKCGQEDYLRICTDRDLHIRLELESIWEFRELSDNVVCKRCAIEYCSKNERQSIKLDDVTLAKDDIRFATAIAMPQLFVENLKDIPGLMDCTLRKMKLHSCDRLLYKWLDKICETNSEVEERVCGHLSWVIMKEIIEKLIEKIDSIILELQDMKNIKCECTQLYEKLEQSATTVNFKSIFERMGCSDDYTPGCPLFYQKYREKRLKLYSIINEISTHHVILPLRNNEDCPLCIFIAYERNRENRIYSKHWLKLVENIWNSEMPSLRSCCYRCLKFLIENKVGEHCYECEIEDKIVGGNHGFWSSRKYPEKKCKNVETDCIVNKTKFWKYDIIFGIRFEIRKIMEKGIENARSYCTMRKLRMMNTMHRLFYFLERVDSRMYIEKYFVENVARVEKYMSSLRFQWDTYVTESEEQPTECICTAPMKFLDDTVKVLWETKDEKLSSHLRLQTELAYITDSFLTKKMKGCPLNYTLPSEQKFFNPTSVEQFFSDFVALFCADDKLLIDSFHIEPQNIDEDSSEAFKNLFVK